jgi:hypothetical protein
LIKGYDRFPGREKAGAAEAVAWLLHETCAAKKENNCEWP